LVSMTCGASGIQGTSIFSSGIQGIGSNIIVFSNTIIFYAIKCFVIFLKIMFLNHNIFGKLETSLQTKFFMT
jgi:hypothetical protein